MLMMTDYNNYIAMSSAYMHFGYMHYSIHNSLNYYTYSVHNSHMDIVAVDSFYKMMHNYFDIVQDCNIHMIALDCMNSDNLHYQHIHSHIHMVMKKCFDMLDIHYYYSHTAELDYKHSDMLRYYCIHKMALHYMNSDNLHYQHIHNHMNSYYSLDYTADTVHNYYKFFLIPYLHSYSYYPSM